MRSILVALMIFVFLVLSIPAYLVMKLIGVFNKHACAAGSQAIIAWFFKLLLKAAGAKMTVIGLENIPKDRAVLYTANHLSYADIPMGYTTVPNLVGFVAKKEIRRFPMLNLWMGNMNCLFLDRKDMRQSLKTILSAIDRVKEGYSMFIMPEGTRNHSGTMLPFKEGSFKIAEKTGCPIVPVAISNSDSIYELHRPWVRAAKVVMHYGEPVFPDEMSKEERKTIGAQVRAKIEAMLEEDKKYIEA